jgi:hypothetical protein
MFILPGIAIPGSCGKAISIFSEKACCVPGLYRRSKFPRKV